MVEGVLGRLPPMDKPQVPIAPNGVPRVRLETYP